MLIGSGISKNISEHLREYGWERIGLVIDKGLYEKNRYVVEIIKILKDKLKRVIVLVNEMPEPTYDYLDKTKAVFSKPVLDCFVGIGGGSTLDLTKGLAVLKTNKGKAINYRGFGKVQKVPLPVVAVPSTAGTGSDVTPWAVFIDVKERWKFGINTEYNYPRLAFYDPRMLDSCPPGVYASAGMDAITHSLESFAAKNATFFSRDFSKRAFKLLFENLKKIAKGDRKKETKTNLLIGSGFAGIALMNSGAGPAGALSYPLGVYFDVPHGVAGSVFLPAVIKYNVDNGYNEYSELYDILYDNPSMPAPEKSMRFAEEIKNLSDELGIPANLKGFGVKSEDDLKLIIDNSMQLKAAFRQNPVKFGKKEIKQVIYSLK